MGLLELLIPALGLSMDAFAVSVCKGLASRVSPLRGSLICGFWFGIFQAIMPIGGFFLGSVFAQAIEAYDHWAAFLLLALIGINMLREAFGADDDPPDGDLSFRSMALLAVATSIDALAVGISLAMAGNVRIAAAAAAIGCVTFLLSAAGFRVGLAFGSRFEKKAEAAGGILLILTGARILLEHLEVFP